MRIIRFIDEPEVIASCDRLGYLAGWSPNI